MKHFLYRHIRNDSNVPFYIGIGTKIKPFSQLKTEYRRANDFKKRSIFWKNVYSKCSGDISVDILFETDSYEEILTKEKEFITIYGREQFTGTLVNLTNGGEGANGVVHTEQHRLKNRLAKLGKKLSKDTIQKMLESRKGYKHSDRTKEKMSISSVGNKNPVGVKRTDEQKKKLSEDRKGKWGVGTKQSEETKNKRTISLNKFYSENPVVPHEVKDEIIKCKLIGMTNSSISAKFNVSITLVKNTYKKWKTRANTTN